MTSRGFCLLGRGRLLNRNLFGLLCLFFLISDISLVSAEEDSIYEILNTIVEQGDYIIVVGDEAPASDSLAATDIAVGLQGYSKGGITLKAQLASEVTDKSKMILLGKSCDNSLIDLSCENWPYKEGETLIKTDDDNLIIAGTTAEDTRKTAKIIAKYKDYPSLKESNIILVTKSGLEIPLLIAEPKSEAEEVICKGNICGTSENVSLPEKGSIEGDKVISNVTEEENVSGIMEEEMVEPKEEKEEAVSFLKRIWEWILKLFKK